MYQPYLNPSNQGVLNFATNMSNLISGNPENYGLDPDDAQAYAALRNAYATALAAAIAPETRGFARTAAKDAAKKALEERTRELSMQINNRVATTDAQRVALGLTVRSDSPVPVPVPTQRPLLVIRRVEGRSVKVRLLDSESGKRRKPEGVLGAALFSYVGTTIPASERDWTFEGNDTRLDTGIDFGTDVPVGASVFLSAMWFNQRGESGPGCVPVQMFIGHDVMAGGTAGSGGTPIATEGGEAFRIAA